MTKAKVGFIYILDSSNSSSFTFKLVSLLLAQFATRAVAQMTTQMIRSVANLCTSNDFGAKAAFVF